jgi:hypothetical protein
MITMKQEYDELIEKLETILPFEAYPTRDMVVKLRQKWKINLKTKVKVVALHNFVEQGGISCSLEDLEPLTNENEAIICGLTHLLILKSNPFFTEIIKYQTKRTKWLAKQQ